MHPLSNRRLLLFLASFPTGKACLIPSLSGNKTGRRLSSLAFMTLLNYSPLLRHEMISLKKTHRHWEALLLNRQIYFCENILTCARIVFVFPFIIFIFPKIQHLFLYFPQKKKIMGNHMIIS